MKRTPLKRKLGIRKQSKKRAAESKVYAKRRKAFLEDNPTCGACVDIAFHLGDVPLAYDFTAFGSRASQHVHHVELRGPNYLKEASWLAVCPWCHTYIHDHPKIARKLGLLK